MSDIAVSITPTRVASDSRTYKIAASLARGGYRSIVVEGSPSELHHPMPFELRAAQPDPTANPSSRLRVHRAVGAARRDLVNVARAVPPASLYYLHSFQPYPGVAWRRRRSRGALVYDAHDFYDEILEPGFGASSKRRLQRRVIDAATEFVVVSEGAADLYEDAYGRRPVVIRNAHDHRLDTSVARGLRETVGVPPEARLLVVVGNAKPTMASEQLIDAMALLPDTMHLAFVGKGHRARLADRIDGSLSARVHLVDPVEPTEVVPFIASADAACVPYRAIGLNARAALPNGFFQSVAAGLPLLVPGDALDLQRLAAGAGVTVDTSDPVSIAEGARQVLFDEDVATRCRADVARLGAELTWEREEVRLLELVRRATGAES
jgi:glycosyltransferase involved in cell wall biosynthesis